MEESRSVTPWVNRLYFESPRASSFLGLRLVKAKHENLVPLFSGVKPDPMVGSGRYAESIPVKSPLAGGGVALRPWGLRLLLGSSTWSNSMVGELRSGEKGFATIYVTGSHRFLFQVYKLQRWKGWDQSSAEKKWWIWPITVSCTLSFIPKI